MANNLTMSKVRNNIVSVLTYACVGLTYWLDSAIDVLKKMHENCKIIDPTIEELDYLEDLELNEIIGEKIYDLYHKVCKDSIVHFMAILRGLRHRFTTKEIVFEAIEGKTEINFEELIENVQLMDKFFYKDFYDVTFDNRKHFNRILIDFFRNFEDNHLELFFDKDQINVSLYTKERLPGLNIGHETIGRKTLSEEFKRFCLQLHIVPVDIKYLDFVRTDVRRIKIEKDRITMVLDDETFTKVSAPVDFNDYRSALLALSKKLDNERRKE